MITNPNSGGAIPKVRELHTLIANHNSRGAARRHNALIAKQNSSTPGNPLRPTRALRPATTGSESEVLATEAMEEEVDAELKARTPHRDVGETSREPSKTMQNTRFCMGFKR